MPRSDERMLWTLFGSAELEPAGELPGLPLRQRSQKPLLERACCMAIYGLWRRLALCFRLMLQVLRLPPSTVESTVWLSDEALFNSLSETLEAGMGVAADMDAIGTGDAPPPKEEAVLAVDVGGTRTKFLLVCGGSSRRLALDLALFALRRQPPLGHRCKVQPVGHVVLGPRIERLQVHALLPGGVRCLDDGLTDRRRGKETIL